MSEIKKDIIFLNRKDSEGRDIEGHLIKEENTIADIARWIIKEDWADEVEYFLRNRNEL